MQTNLSNQTFIDAATTSKTIREALMKLGLKGKGGNYATFKRRAKLLSLELPYLTTQRQSYQEKRASVLDIDIITLATQVHSRQHLLRKLGLNHNVGSNVRWIVSKLSLLKVDTSHWTGQAHNKGQQNLGKLVKIEKFLSNEKSCSNFRSFKAALIYQQLLKPECSTCGIESWLSLPLSLHLDHIDGNRENNSLENLRLLCPNCHSQTPTYCRRKSSL